MPKTPTRLIEFETIDSTNSEAHRRAAAGERGPLWIRAGRQKAGRGRSGRPWSSPPGNLSATFMFSPRCERSVIHQLSFVAGLAAYDAVVPNLANPKLLQLKWPNDLLITGAKVSGILIESSQYEGDTVVMIGIGMNIAVAPQVEGREVTQLNAHGSATPPGPMLEALAATMDTWLHRWQAGAKFAAIRTAWLDRAHPLGQPLTVNTNDRRLEGTFQGLAAHGALLLKAPSGKIVQVEHGDVSLTSDQATSKERA